jgi:hypothetical protein
MATVRDFGAKGDGKADDTTALTHAVQRGDGHLVFPRGDYRITRPLHIPLQLHGRISLVGAGGTARIIMAGAGPALHFVGTHKRTALPEDFKEAVWTRERLPMVRDLEIVGDHAEADGLRFEGAMQPTLQGLLIRRCRHGVHLANRDRNVVVSDCHIYDNRGVGIFLDRVNLHQTNLVGNHISYCKQGGIKIVGSEVRNLQIVGNDIEYNFDRKAPASADVLFDCREGTVREGTISGNTIQASQSPGGANIRMIGVGKKDPNAVGLFAITGNLLGSQETVLHLQACRGVVVSGNCIYSGYQNAVVAEDTEHLVIGANSLDHNPEYRGQSTDRFVIRGCRNVTVTGLVFQHTRPAGQEVEASLTIRDSQAVSVTGCQIIHARRRGILIHGSSVVRVADCTIHGRPDDRDYRAAVAVDRVSRQVMVVNNFLGKGNEGALVMPRDSGVAAGNLTI